MVFIRWEQRRKSLKKKIMLPFIDAVLCAELGRLRRIQFSGRVLKAGSQREKEILSSGGKQLATAF